MEDLDPALETVLSGTHQGVLAVVRADGRPHLSNVLFTWDAAARTVRVASTVDRVKVRALRRSSAAAIHVAGDHFWAYAVAEGTSEVIDPGSDRDTLDELLCVYRSVLDDPDEDALRVRIVRERRVLIRISINHVYGLVRASARSDVRR